jgi:hypothetical protein
MKTKVFLVLALVAALFTGGVFAGSSDDEFVRKAKIKLQQDQESLRKDMIQFEREKASMSGPARWQQERLFQFEQNRITRDLNKFR